MSCERCEVAQELRGPELGLRQVFLRVGNGNVELVGCVDHIRDLLEAFHSWPGNWWSSEPTQSGANATFPATNYDKPAETPPKPD